MPRPEERKSNVTTLLYTITTVFSLPASAWTTSVCSEMQAYTLVFIPNVNVANICEHLGMVMQILLALAHTTLCQNLQLFIPTVLFINT